MKNRLYREIKARQLAEFWLKKPITYEVTQRKIETLCCARMVTPQLEDLDGYMDYAKKSIAQGFVKKLMEEGFIKTVIRGDDMGNMMIRQYLDVVKPREGIEEWQI